MKWLLLLLGLIQAMTAQATVIQHKLGEDLRLVSIDTDTQLKRAKGFYSLNISHQGKNLGLVKDYDFGSSWRGSLGLLMADDVIDISTARSDIIIGNQSFDLNRYLGMHAQVRFFGVSPFASIAFQYRNEDNDMVFDFISGLKLLRLDESRIQFDKELGIFLETSFPELSSRLKQEAMSDLKQYYLLPVIDFRFNYSF